MPSTYLPLSVLFPKESIPQELQFLQGGIDTVFGKINYKDLRHGKDFSGVNHSYSVIIGGPSLAFTIPGADLVLWLNAPPGNTDSSEFPITVQVQWEILKYIKMFSITNFSSLGDAFVQLAQKIIPADELHLLAVGANVFANDNLQQFINNANEALGLSFIYDSLLSPTENADNFLTYLRDTEHISVWEVVLTSYFTSGTPKQLKTNAESFLNTLVIGQKTLPPGTKSALEKIEDLFIPKISAMLTIQAGIDFPRNVLLPLKPNGEVETDESIKTRIIFGEVDFYYSTFGRFGIQGGVDISFEETHPLAQIGTTPLSIGFRHAKLDLSRTTNLPEAYADGRPKDFIGVYVQEADIGFPAFWNHDDENPTAYIKGRNLIIGTGGISGIISLEAALDSNDEPYENPKALFKLGQSGDNEHFSLALTAFEMEFKQNAIIRSDIRGKMTIPGFKDADLNVTVHIGNNGDFRITVSEDNGVQALVLEDVFELKLKSVSIGYENNRWYIEASGSLLITATIPGIETNGFKTPIDIKKVRIWQNGSIEFEGGNISLPTQIKINFGPVALALNDISFGSYEAIHRQNNTDTLRRYSFFGFNGALNTGTGGLEVRGDGIQFHFTTDNSTDPAHQLDTYVRISGIYVDIRIPGNLPKKKTEPTGNNQPAPEPKEDPALVLIKGWLKINRPLADDPNPEIGNEYIGGVSVELKKLHISGKAGMRLKPKVPAWIVDLEVEPGVPLPLGPSGLGIYGYRGLIGSNYVASKAAIQMADDAPWYDYLKKKVPPEFQQGIYISKFDSKKKAFSVGLGASVGTISDNGHVFSAKVFMLLSLPELLLIEGKAGVLKKRIGLNDKEDPPFYAYLILEFGESITAGVGVNLNIPKSGEILKDLKGQMEVYFNFHSSSAWHIYVGQDQPEDKRLSAKILKIVKGYAYLMISPQIIKVGAGAKFEVNWKFSKVRLEVRLYFDIAGFISFKPIQAGGSVDVGGYLGVRVFSIKIGFSIDTHLSAEAPKPFIIAGHIQIGIPLFFKTIKLKVGLTWTFNKSLHVDEQPILLEEASNPNDPVSYPFKGVSMLTEKTFNIHYASDSLPANPVTAGWDMPEYVIPMDTYIDIEFKAPVKPYTNRYGGGITPEPQFSRDIAPRKAKMPQVKHEFIIENIQIKIWNGTGWIDYDMWQALTEGFTEAGLQVSGTNAFPYGYWQYNNSPGKYSSLRLLAETPLSVTKGLPPENFGLSSAKLFCRGEFTKENCQNWLTINKGTVYESRSEVIDRALILKIGEENAAIASFPNPFGYRYSLKVETGNKLEIFFTEPAMEAKLRITCLPGVTVTLYKKRIIGSYDEDGEYTGPEDSLGLPATEFVEIEKQDYSFEGLNEQLIYLHDSTEESFDKILIEPREFSSDLPGMFNDYWNSASLYLQNLADDPATSAADREFYLQWIEEYFYYPAKDLINKALEELVPLWGKLRQNFSLNEYDHNVLLSWLNEYSTFHPEGLGTPGNEYEYEYEYQDYEGVGMVDFCMQWSALLNNPEVSDWFKQYIRVWKEKFCTVRPLAGIEDLSDLYIHSVCWKTEKDWELDKLLYENDQESITAGVATLSETINSTIPVIWRPNSYFGIIVSTKDNVKINNKTDRHYQRNFALGFKTGNTLGLNKNSSEEPKSNFSDELSDLRNYIDYERSYPDAAGKLINAKPLYYLNPKLGLFFTKRYVYEFFMKWGEYENNPGFEYKLMPVIVDPESKSAVLPLLPVGWNIWPAQEVPIRELDVETYSYMLVNSGDFNCTAIIDALIPKTLITEPISAGPLKPQKQYTALFNVTEIISAKKAEVHSYVFKTSKYPDFVTHINSYYRKVVNTETGISRDVKALYAIVLKFSQGVLLNKITLIRQLIAGRLSAGSRLHNNYATDYDRILYGILNFKSEPAVTDVEINVIKANVRFRQSLFNSTPQLPEWRGVINEGKIILGILIKSPEPFCDPKLPASEVAKTIVVDGQPGLKYIFSKDNSCVFITNSWVLLPASRVDIQFQERYFDGINYVANEQSTVTISVQLNGV
ncbi:MAG TPA: hypothetical protein PKC39_02225 [Ferruginibacter sp.]|nr:hypothetical protein [Ferruginibacter sp.]HMP19752.1 hypothetical protein [Ferruginibacter sp.]